MLDHCQRHDKKPDEIFEGDLCYGELFECDTCHRTVCSGYGAADEEADSCDSCWYTKHYPAQTPQIAMV